MKWFILGVIAVMTCVYAPNVKHFVFDVRCSEGNVWNWKEAERLAIVLYVAPLLGCGLVVTYFESTRPRQMFHPRHPARMRAFVSGAATGVATIAVGSILLAGDYVPRVLGDAVLLAISAAITSPAVILMLSRR